MIQPEQILQALQAYRQILAEEEAEGVETPILPDLPRLRSVLTGIRNCPPNSLLLGLATDGLPLLLNLSNPAPGALLLTGQPGSGKTAYLQMVATAAARMHTPRQLQTAVLTSAPEEWDARPEMPNLLGIWDSTNLRGVRDLFFDLMKWAQNPPDARTVVLLIDHYPVLSHLTGEDRESLEWMLAQGPSHHIWPLVTLDAETLARNQIWSASFGTHLYSRIDDEALLQTLRLNGLDLETLLPTAQFIMRKRAGALRFWSPTLD